MIKAVRRFDLGQITSVERTPQGFLRVPGFATRTGVFTYIAANGQVRRELRHPDDVFDPESLASLKNAPVTLEHPPVMLNPDNVKDYTKGWTTDHVEVNRDLVATDLIIAMEDAIDAVENQGIRELSAGYMADLEEVPGVYNGCQYDVRQRNIKYNHLAIVKKGRAGPEARLRMDSADAVLTEENPSQPANQFQTEGENDSEEEEINLENSEGNETKTIVISGEKVELPSGIADIVQSMMDRYDQLRGEVAKLKEESMANRKDTKDADISQKNVSPQVNVQQMAPDGRGGAAKKDEDQQGVVGGQKPNSYAGGSKALQDNEMPPQKQDGEFPGEKKKEDGEMGPPQPEKKDYEGAPQPGVAMSPADRLASEIQAMEAQLQQMKAKHDAMQAKVDEYASQSMGQGEGKPGNGQKMDSADWRSAVSKRVKLIRTAEKMVPAELAARFDSLDDESIMATTIKHCSPSTDLHGKSTVYLETRFDLMAEKISEGTALRKEMGSHLLNSRMDTFGDVDLKQARLKAIQNSKNEWQAPLSAVKK